MFSIMVVDDEKSVREGLVKYLLKQNALFDEVYSAANGTEALEILGNKRPQIIITDINMPHMNGLEFIEELKKQDREVQIIVLSGYDEFSYAQRAMRNGVEHYLLKPVDRRELIGLLSQMKDTYLQQRRTKEEHVLDRERVQVQQKRLCDRLLNIMMDGPIDRDAWHYELDLMDLWKDGAVYGICIMNQAPQLGETVCNNHVEQFEKTCRSYQLRYEKLRENERELVFLLVADSTSKEEKLEMWVKENRSEGWLEPYMKMGSTVRSISEIYISYLSAKKELERQEDIAERALKLIQNKWNDSTLTLNEIAGKLYISHNYLRTLIKERTGSSFVKYLTEIRLERAAEILQTTELKVQEVARNVGFEDAAYFTRVFTKKYHCSPVKFREKQ